MSPRRFAEKLIEEFRQLSRDERSPAVFVDLAEQIINEAIAFEFRWLAGYLEERAKRMATSPDAYVEQTSPTSLPTAHQLPPDVPSGQLPK